MVEVWREVRQGLRQLVARPGFAAVVVGVLAIGIGVTTAVFSLANALLLRPVVAAEPERLVHVHSTDADGSGFHAFSYPDFVDLEASSGDVLSALAAWNITQLSVADGGEAEAAIGQLVSAGYFEVFGLAPAAGRYFSPEGETAPVAVISDGLWQRRFGGRPEVVGSTITVNGHPVTVIGVAPPGFTGQIAVLATEVWVPMSLQPILLPEAPMNDRRRVWLELVGRLAPGVSREQAEERLSALAAHLGEQLPEPARGRGVDLTSVGALPSQVRSAVAAFLAVLLALVGLVLALTCVNVAGMLLARAGERRHEMAVRLALGAGRGRLVRQLLTEGALLATLGGAAGLALSLALGRLLLAVDLPLPVPVALDLGLDGRVLAFTLAVSALTALAFALAPALAVTRPALASALRGEAGSRQRLRLRRALVVAQVALALLLTVTAGLLLRALGTAADIDPGLQPEGVWVAGLDLSLGGYDEAAGRQLYGELVERLQERPEVAAASLLRMVPLGLGNSTSGVKAPGREGPSEGLWPVDVNTVGVGYFETLGIPIRQGRAFSAWDRDDSAPVAIINETLAERLWPGEPAVGRYLVEPLLDGERRLEVVGVAADGKYRSLGEAPRSFVYRPFGQQYSAQMTLAVKAAAGPTASVVPAAVRQELARLDPDLPLLSLVSLPESLSLSLLPQKLAASLTGAFSLLGLLLSGLGLYGLTAFLVTQRRREIGVRMALGARRRDVAGLVVRQGAALAAVGVAVGLALSLLATRALAGLLYGVSPSDPLTLAATALLLALVTVAASWLPARRAATVDPVQALRADGG